MTKDKALKLALEALCKMIPCDDVCDCTGQQAITAIKEALAQPEQEPVEDVVAYHSDGTRTVRIAPKRPWVGLTDEQIWKFWSSRPEVLDGEDDGMEAEFVAAVRRVLAAHDIGAKP